MSKTSGHGDSHPFSVEEEVFGGDVPSRLEERHALIRRALRQLAKAGARPDEYVDRFHLDEIIVNAMVHGNGLDSTRCVAVRAFLGDGHRGFEVSDQGDGFDWRALDTAPNHAIDMNEDSGHGLKLIRASGGNLHFLRGGSRVVIVRENVQDDAAG